MTISSPSLPPSSLAFLVDIASSLMWFGFACRRFSAVIIMYEYDDAVVPPVTLLSSENGTFLYLPQAVRCLGIIVAQDG